MKRYSKSARILFSSAELRDFICAARFRGSNMSAEVRSFARKYIEETKDIFLKSQMQMSKK